MLQAEILDLKTNFESKATGVVLESKIDIGRGPVVTTIITSGTLKKGDYFVSGLKWGKSRALINDMGKNIEEAPPSSPIEILGINGAARAGDDFIVLNNEKEAKTLCDSRIQESKDNKTVFRSNVDYACINLDTYRPTRMPDLFKEAYKITSN